MLAKERRVLLESQVVAALGGGKPIQRVGITSQSGDQTGG